MKLNLLHLKEYVFKPIFIGGFLGMAACFLGLSFGFDGGAVGFMSGVAGLLGNGIIKQDDKACKRGGL